MSNAGKHDYEDKFFDYIETGARRSARHIVALLHRHLSVSSVLDVGCGRGVWAEEWRRNGVADAVGVDGSYVSIDQLVMAKEQFAAFDLSKTFRLDRRFDLVQSLEVAEHIPSSRVEVFVSNLVAHGDLILFSAAVPGQGGEFHVNEQPYEYWRDKFSSHGYKIFDFIRPNIRDIRTIEPWYRYNTFLFAQESAWNRMPQTIRRTELRQDEPIVDLAPLLWRLRKLTFRYLPQPVVQRIARLKHSAVRAGLMPN
jgi:SAM-dependent methyltransferase